MGSGLGRRIVKSVAACAVNLRSPDLRRAQAAFGLVWAGEWAATVVVGVIAFRHGGAPAVGLVAAARMVPAALVAPAGATIADRLRREQVLSSVGATRAVTLGLAGLVAAAGGPVEFIYVLLVLATVAQTLFRPTHSALLPSLCTTPAELTSANVVRGLLDSVATLVGPLAAALLLKVSGPAAGLFAAAGASAIAATLIVSLRYESPPRLTRARGGGVAAELIEGVRAIAGDQALKLLTALTTLQTFTRGALTVFSVTVAIELLHSGNAGVGVLTAAVGGGAVAGALSATMLVGRGGLARWFGLGVALWGAPLTVIGLSTHWWSAVGMLAIVGLGNALVDVGVFTLLARLADDAVLARVFAAFEGIITLGVAGGALITPVMIGALGIRTALVAVGALAPAAVVACWPALRRLDLRVRVRDADIALLQRIPMLRILPEATIEQLAARLSRTDLPPAASVFEQGDEGQDFYVIETGQARVVRDGQPVRMLEPGDCFGEIALIRDCPRTASVRAATPLTLRGLTRAVFLAAVTGYTRSAEAVDRVVTEHLRASPSAGELPGIPASATMSTAARRSSNPR
jgi:MFS family permease